jgi:hypothetical protein
MSETMRAFANQIVRDKAISESAVNRAGREAYINAALTYGWASSQAMKAKVDAEAGVRQALLYAEYKETCAEKYREITAEQ